MQLQRHQDDPTRQAAAHSAPSGRRIEWLFVLVLAVCLIIVTFRLVGAKENVFMDEALSYSQACSNPPHSTAAFYVTQDDPAGFFREFYAASLPFRYDIVYRAESTNVHPPLYYYLLHTALSLFPGRFSLYFAGAINALFAAGTLLMLYGILCLLTQNGKVRILLCAFYVLSPGVWNNLSFLRMYVMLGFWITALTYLYLANEKKPVRFYGLWLFLTVYCGIQTHYHFLIWLAVSSLTYLVILLVKRDGKTILRHVPVILTATLCAIVSFPPLFNQILHSNRGTEAKQNIMHLSGFFPRIRWFVNYTGQELFGRLGNAAVLVFLVCLIVLIIVRLRKKTPAAEDLLSLPDLCMLILPAGLYFMIVSVSASFFMLRYIYAVYPLLLTAFGLVLYNGLLLLPTDRRGTVPLLASALVLILLFAFRTATFPHLYRGDAEKREALLPYADTDCLYLIQKERMYAAYLADYQELSLYGSLTAVDAFAPGTPAEAFSDRDRLILVTDDGLFHHSDDLPGEIEEFCIRNGLPSRITDLGKFSNDTHTFLCEKGNGSMP